MFKQVCVDSFHLNASAQCSAITLSQIGFFIGILGSGKTCFKTGNSATWEVYPWGMLL